MFEPVVFFLHLGSGLLWLQNWSSATQASRRRLFGAACDDGGFSADEKVVREAKFENRVGH